MGPASFSLLNRIFSGYDALETRKNGFTYFKVTMDNSGLMQVCDSAENLVRHCLRLPFAILVATHDAIEELPSSHPYELRARRKYYTYNSMTMYMHASVSNKSKQEMTFSCWTCSKMSISLRILSGFEHPRNLTTLIATFSSVSKSIPK